MKIITVAALLVSLSTSTIDVPKVAFKETIKKVDVLIPAIIYVESRGNDSAIGDGGLAVGCLQIHPILVRECNRILNSGIYTLEDRYSRSKSIEMFNVIRSNIKNGTNEEIARRWNGGPNGHNKSATLKYWSKVKNQMKKL